MITAIDGSLPIHYAAERGNIAIMENLLEAGASQGVDYEVHISKEDNEKQTVLHRAVQSGKKEVSLSTLNISYDVFIDNHIRYTIHDVFLSFGFDELFQLY